MAVGQPPLNCLTLRYREQALLPQRSLGRTQFFAHRSSNVGASLLAMAVGQQHWDRLTLRYREQALLPQTDLCQTQLFLATEVAVWERACSRWRWVIHHGIA